MVLFFPLLNLRMQLGLHCLGERGGMGAAHGPLQSFRELQLSKSWPRLPCAVAPMQITQAEHVAPIKPWKHRMQCPMHLCCSTIAQLGTMTGLQLPLHQVSKCLTFGERSGAVVLPLTAFSLHLLDLLNGIRLGQHLGSGVP